VNGELESLPGLNSFAVALNVNSFAEGFREDLRDGEETASSLVEVVTVDITVTGVAELTLEITATEVVVETAEDT